MLKTRAFSAESDDPVESMHFRLNRPNRIHHIVVLEVSGQFQQAKLLNSRVYINYFHRQNNFSNAEHATRRRVKIDGKCTDSAEIQPKISAEFTRHVYQAIMGSARWDIFVKLSKQSRVDPVIIIFWPGAATPSLLRIASRCRSGAFR